MAREHDDPIVLRLDVRRLTRRELLQIVGLGAGAAAAEGLDINAQKANIGKAALAYNELLPTIQIWERYGNGPALSGTRVTGWPPDGDPIYQNDMYNDSFVTFLVAQGTLGPV